MPSFFAITEDRLRLMLYHICENICFILTKSVKTQKLCDSLHYLLTLVFYHYNQILQTTVLLSIVTVPRTSLHRALITRCCQDRMTLHQGRWGQPCFQMKTQRKGSSTWRFYCLYRDGSLLRAGPVDLSL